MNNVERALMLDNQIEELKRFESKINAIGQSFGDLSQKTGAPDESKNENMNDYIRNSVRIANQSKSKRFLR